MVFNLIFDKNCLIEYYFKLQIVIPYLHKKKEKKEKENNCVEQSRIYRLEPSIPRAQITHTLPYRINLLPIPN